MRIAHTYYNVMLYVYIYLYTRAGKRGLDHFPINRKINIPCDVIVYYRCTCNVPIYVLYCSRQKCISINPTAAETDGVIRLLYFFRMEKKPNVTISRFFWELRQGTDTVILYCITIIVRRDSARRFTRRSDQPKHETTSSPCIISCSYYCNIRRDGGYGATKDDYRGIK